ncbi:uncharacterized protein C2845_PM08G11740 [Panicum miliaceum]|uniref:Uncharacterized protein n=1 Tax=Panicum miliaceum TaxID=4540 RepID=A0A3L6QXA0_PANMI|nr:uncharacterized protein C2845_PM08G11740 [Panicum miliaceum]
MAAIRTKFDLPLRRQIDSYLILRERNKKQTHATCPGPDMNKMRIVGDNNFGEQKTHHRCRRKKHDVRMLDSLR